MSPQATAKAVQGYQVKPVHPTCANCRHFASDTIIRQVNYWSGMELINKRCTLGNFAVSGKGTCNQHKPK